MCDPRSYGNQPLSFAIVCDRDSRISEVCFHVIADLLRSALRDQPLEYYANKFSTPIPIKPLGLIVHVYSPRGTNFGHQPSHEIKAGSQIAIGLRSSAIIWKHTSAILRSLSQTIAEDKAGFHMIADDRRPYCDVRSAIIWKPAFIFCDRLRS